MTEVNRNIYSVAKEMNQILKTISHHTKMGMWDGIDGLKNLLTHHNIMMYFKQQDAELYNMAMSLVIMKIIKESDKHLEYDVLRGFVYSFRDDMQKFIIGHEAILAGRPAVQHIIDSILSGYGREGREL